MQLEVKRTETIKATVDLNDFIGALAKEVGVNIRDYTLASDGTLLSWERSTWSDYDWKPVRHKSEHYEIIRKKLQQIVKIREAMVELGVLGK